LAAAQDAARAVQPDPVPAEQTAAAVVDPGWKPPRTSWGDPDLQGVWTSDDMSSVPTQRPRELGTRDRLAPEEFAKRAAADAQQRGYILNQAAYSSRSVGSRTFGYTSLIVDPPDGRIPDIVGDHPTPTRGTFGRGPFEDLDDFTLYDRCITRGIRSIVPTPSIYGNGVRIAQGPDSVAISYEMIHETRVVRLGGAPHASDDIRQYLGDSRGYWDGDTLVIESQNLTDKTSVSGVYHSKALKITERLRRVDPEMIEYTATIQDPLTYKAPFTYRIMLTTQPGYHIFEYSCHEGNQAIANSLKGARAYEAAVREAIAKGEPVPDPVPFTEWNRLDLPEDDDAFADINAGQ
jgi:hypothetical protein